MRTSRNRAWRAASIIGASSGHTSVATVDSEREIASVLRRLAAPGDMVVCLGAGNSTEWAHALPDWLAGEPLRAGGAA